MFNVGGGEVVVILMLALIVLGPDKLPSTARQAGRYLSEFRRMTNGFQAEIRNAIDMADRPLDKSLGTFFDAAAERADAEPTATGSPEPPKPSEPPKPPEPLERDPSLDTIIGNQPISVGGPPTSFI
jgi:sec-independent protein translocase protein TatB